MAGGIHGEAPGEEEGHPGGIDEARNGGFRPEQIVDVFGVPTADERVRHGQAHPHVALGRCNQGQALVPGALPLFALRQTALH